MAFLHIVTQLSVLDLQNQELLSVGRTCCSGLVRLPACADQLGKENLPFPLITLCGVL